MRLAYADPSYPGQAARHYSHDPDCAEVNHRVLMGWLCEDFDAWALSTSSPALASALAMAPKGCRVGAWTKPFASFKPNVNPAYAWEPVIFWGGRKRERTETTVRDWYSEGITLKKGLCGAKPAGFMYWIFGLLGAKTDDEFCDVFPGTGGCGAAWDRWSVHGGRQRRLFSVCEERLEQLEDQHDAEN